MKNKNNTTHLDEYKFISIHESEVKLLTKPVRQFIEDYSFVEFYPKERNVDKVKEFKKLIRKYIKEIKKNKGKESNPECIMISQMVELLQKMMAHQVRKLHLEKLIQ